MEQPQATGDAYSGFSPLMSSILELTREIENLDDEPLVREPRKVLWAKKRFPRQGIRCRATTSSKRRKYIGATARDFPSLMLSKSVLPIRIPAAIPVERPPQVNEILSERKREGSAETRQETDSSASDPDPAAKNLGNGAQTSTASRDDAENLSSNNNDENNVYCADGYMIGDKIHTSINDAEDSSPDLVDSGVWYNGTNSKGDDDSSNRAINVTGDEEEDADSTYSSYSTRNDEISVEYLGNPTVSPHERVKYVIVSENYYQVNSALDCHDYHSNVTMNGSEIDASTTKSFKSVCSKRKPGRPRKHKGMKNKQDKQNELAQPGPSSQDSGSGRSSAKRSKTTKVKGSETCRAGKRCFGCTDSSPVDTPASTNVGTRDLASSSRPLTAKQKSKQWTKNDWDNFFCVFSAVAAEAHTLQSLGSNNTAANKRWLQCMRTVLQKPPF